MPMDPGDTYTHRDREPAVAGQFYPANKDQLSHEVNKLFAQAVPLGNWNTVRALISPHAGYVFSGKIAASAYNQISKKTNYSNVFILASSHYVGFRGASVYSRGDFLLPGRNVRVDQGTAQKLIRENNLFTDYPEAHGQEHSIEVQLPFLQHQLGDNLRIVPIVIGTNRIDDIQEIAAGLKPYFIPENLFVVSTDFSHYPSWDNACKTDKLTAEAILKNDPEEFLKIRQIIKERHIPDLATPICGWTSMLTLLYLSAGNQQLHYHLIDYCNSGDNQLYGEKGRVVGYHAIILEETPDEKFQITPDEQKQLLAVAREKLKSYLNDTSFSFPSAYPPLFDRELGAFVSLYKGTELRGCMGRFQCSEPLMRTIAEMTIASANDSRFLPVTADEADELTIEISVLSPLKRIHSIDEFELGKHGIYIKKNFNSGTFLPQVAKKSNWTREEFIAHCSHDKAHLGWNGWKTAELYTYEACVFSDNDFK